MASLSPTMLRALRWVATPDHGPFTEGLGFTRATIDALRRRGLVRFDRAAIDTHRGPKLGGYEYEYVFATPDGLDQL